MGDIFGGGSSGTLGGGVLGTFLGAGGISADRAARRAAEEPTQFSDTMNLLMGLLKSRTQGGNVTPFVEPTPAPNIGITPLEQELTNLSQSLVRDVGVKPIGEAFTAARGLAGQSLNLGDIAGEVTPLLSPAIQNVLTQEGRDRRQLGEELTSQGAGIGSPLLENQRLLQEGTNRNIAEMVANAVMQERGLRGGEVAQGGQQLQGLGVVAPNLAAQFASLPRDVASQQFGLQQQADTARQAATQQVLALFDPMLGAGANAFDIRSNADIQGELLRQAARQQRIDTTFKVAQAASASTARVKKDITPLDTDEYTKALGRVRDTPIVRYRYKWEDEQTGGAPHIGPILELSPEEIKHPNKVHVRMLDYLGLQHAAMKGLDKDVRKLAGQLRRAVRVKDAKAT